MERETIEQKNVEQARQRLKRRYSELYNEIGVERLLRDVQNFSWKTGEIVFTDRIDTTHYPSQMGSSPRDRASSGRPERTDYRYLFGYRLEASEMDLRAYISVASNLAIHPNDMGATLNQLYMLSFHSDTGVTDSISTRGVNMRDANIRMRGLLAQDEINRKKEHKYPFD